MRIHESHEIEEYWADDTPHSPMFSCKNCWEGICSICYDIDGLSPVDPLALPCVGED